MNTKDKYLIVVDQLRFLGEDDAADELVILAATSSPGSFDRGADKLSMMFLWGDLGDKDATYWSGLHRKLAKAFPPNDIPMEI